ncbi:hypothetical protein PAHAL_1G440100 [Panicum hallii]|uniref:Diphthine--ammonia ligase n=1 Tax=Panicum hallii TaxID=206008 RepID=A0A2S3GUB8_9POAL|nr:hypothetical protein PAHAL_1G440100 [Panicum hallii]
MEVVALVSGGKDSCFAMMRCLDYGHKVVALANLIPLDDGVDELDSYMYQTVGHQIVVSYAKCMGLPLFRRRIRGSTRDQGLKYNVTAGDEVEDMFALLSEVKRQIPSISAVSSGAIASDYQRLRVESVCSRLGLVSLAYLWKQDQTLLLEEMIRRGIVAITVKVAALGLKPSSHLGKELAELKCHLLQMNESYGINVCGEGGEYETLTLDCPLFCNARIILDDYEVILHSADSIASVGILHPRAFHLEHKPDSSDTIGDGSVTQDISSCVYEVDEVITCTDEEKHTLNPAVDACTNKDLCISKTGKNLRSISCWIQDRSRDLEVGLKEDLIAVLSGIDNQLQEEGLGWVNVLYVHLYISNMKEFGLANEVYVSFITEKKCYLGVPSRSTIELPLVQVGLGKAYVEVLVSDELKKRVLHVQSISCWAPSCIGPYSQATLYGEILYMAGQLGLDPPTMKLCPGGATAELELALQNSEAVANAFSCSIYSSAIHFLVYCSAQLTSDEKDEVEQTLQSSYITRLDCSKTGLYPTVLYVFAPDLPKGARVEIKPILYVPTNDDGVATREMETGMTQPAPSQAWSAQYSDLHDSCCQIHTIDGRICSAVVSVTSDIASKICSTAGQLYHTEDNLKAMARFCAFQIVKILGDNKFSWDSITMLRFYYSVENSVAADAMSRAFSEAFTELAEDNSSLRTDESPCYNIVPVSAKMRLLACCYNDPEMQIDPDTVYPIRPDCRLDAPKTRFKPRAGLTLSPKRWKLLHNEEGVLDIAGVIKRVQRGGIHPTIKGEVWEFLLGCYDPKSTTEQRNQLRQQRRLEYEKLKTKCREMDTTVGSGRVITMPVITEDGQPIADPNADGGARPSSVGSEQQTTGAPLPKEVIQWKLTLHQIGLDVNRTDRVLVYYESQENLARLWDILSVYSWVDKDIGYCQGMSDLCSPISIILEHEADAFWCFERLMHRVRRNFQSTSTSIGVRAQLTTLSTIMKSVDPKLHEHLENLDGGEYLFAFRMLMVLFRREFSFVDTMYLWELQNVAAHVVYGVQSKSLFNVGE